MTDYGIISITLPVCKWTGETSFHGSMPPCHVSYIPMVYSLSLHGRTTVWNHLNIALKCSVLISLLTQTRAQLRSKSFLQSDPDRSVPRDKGSEDQASSQRKHLVTLEVIAVWVHLMGQRHCFDIQNSV